MAVALSSTNLYGEEWEPPQNPIVNLSPERWRDLLEAGFANGFPSYAHGYLQDVMTWICQRALDLEEQDHPATFTDDDDCLVFIFNVWDVETIRNVSWMFTFELLDERASYYDVKRVERMD